MKDAKLTPLKAIRAKCIECVCGSKAEVRKCVIPSCPLYPYRMGHDPHRKGIGGKGGGFSVKKHISANDSEHDSRSGCIHTSGNLEMKNTASVGGDAAEKENRPGEESTETAKGELDISNTSNSFLVSNDNIAHTPCQHLSYNTESLPSDAFNQGNAAPDYSVNSLVMLTTKTEGD